MKNILVVDDEPNILTLVTVNLIRRGYLVSSAKNGTEALAHICQSQPALMVLDIKLPDYTGWEVLQRVKSACQIVSSFPVLLMTASITETSVDREAYPSVVDILIKPFSAAALMSAVEHVLGRG